MMIKDRNNNSIAFKELQRLALEDSKRKAPSFPDAYRVTHHYSDKTSAKLTRCIVDFLRFSGFKVENNRTSGRVIDQRKTYVDVIGRTRLIGSSKYIRPSKKEGTADISAVIKARLVQIVIKIGKDPQSDLQRKYHEAADVIGDAYFVASDFQSFYDWYQLQFVQR
jgi:hypothetical protein